MNKNHTSAAATSAAPNTIHPGLSNEELIALLVVAAEEALGQQVTIVRFRRMGSMDWAWSVQGRTNQHLSHNL